MHVLRRSVRRRLLSSAARRSHALQPATSAGQRAVETARWDAAEHARLLEATTRALAPAGEQNVTLPQAEAEDLSRLYDALTQPLRQPPSREDRLSRMTVEDTSADGFWRRRSRSLEACAYRVRCLGVQGDLPGAHAAFDEMQAAGLRPDAAAYAALVDACAKGGDAAAARGVLAEMRRAGVAPNAPVWTGLMQAHLAAGDPPEAVTAVLREMEDGGAVVDVPAHTAVVQAYVRHGRLQEAWHAFDEMRLKGRLPDAVTFALMMHVCALADQLEQADGLWNDMLMSGVAPTLAAHNSYISACASRARSLSRLPRRKREWLHKLSVGAEAARAVPRRPERPRSLH